jgi:hypothetical protein
MVPGARFELARGYPYAPQTYVSTKFHHPGRSKKGYFVPDFSGVVPPCGAAVGGGCMGIVPGAGAD